MRMTETSPNTPRQLIDWTERRFAAAGLCYGHGADEARSEAVFLVCGALDLPFGLDASELDLPLSCADSERVQELARERISARKPVAYLLNKAWFAELPLYVDERVLVPRSPLAEVALGEFAPWIRRDQVRDILDLGTGSGCLAIACARVFPEARVDAADLSPAALEVAKINRARHGLQERIALIQSDVYEALGDKRYDVIVSNPPYVPVAAMATLPAEYQHEPPLALRAGADGLAIVDRILLDAHRHLRDHGVLVAEVGNRREALEAKYPRTPFMWLELEHGGEGVFLLTRQELAALAQAGARHSATRGVELDETAGLASAEAP